MSRTSIAEWFRGRHVFITGGVGYMGKTLVYKLLHSCPDIGNIFLLLREKKKETVEDRLRALVESELLQTIREEYPERLKKIVAVKGDACFDGLGLSLEDKQMLLPNVSVVFHMAANVRFDATLTEAVRSNVQATTYVVSFAKQLSKLESFIHVSTAFSHCHVEYLEERMYPTSVDPQSMINTVNTMPEEAVTAMTNKLLGEQPNTYAFSKSLGERVVYESGLTAGIARPSIVVPSLKEPIPGWVESLNGPTGLMIGASKGVIRSVRGNGKFIANVVPCDLAVNAIIAFAWKVGLDKPTMPIFCNITQNKDNPLSWSDAIKIGREIVMLYPLENILWMPGGNVTTSNVRHYVRVALFQYLPAYLLDILLYLMGIEPFLMKVQRKIQRSEKLIDYYIMKEWLFEEKRIKELEAEMSPADRDTYPMDTSSICWRDYMVTYMIGCKKYLKDDMSNLPRWRRIIRIMYYADKIAKALFFLFLGWLFYTLFISYSGPSNSISGGSVVKEYHS